MASVYIQGGLTPKCVVFDSFCRSMFTKRVARGCFFGVSLPSTASLFECLPKGLEDKRMGCFSFSCLPFYSYGQDGGGGDDAGIYLLSAAVHLVCMPADCENECAGLFSLLRFHLFNLYKLGGRV